MDILRKFEDVFFDERFWLPSHVSWKDLANNPDDTSIYKAQPGDLWLIFPLALALFVARLIFERLIAEPIGKSYGLSSTVPKATSNPVLEAAYKRNQYPPPNGIQSLMKQTDLSERSIQRWLRRRRNQDRPTPMTKFTETLWRCCFYLVVFVYGLYILSQKSWFYDVKDCWRGYPNHHVSADVFWYYMVELAFYIGLLFSQFTDVKRKDFWEQFIHHIATIVLMWFSWSTNFYRVGTLILCLHDAVDYLLEAAKIAKYVGKNSLAEGIFGLFTITWFCTRNILFPYVILYTTLVDLFEIVGPAPSLYLLNGLLCILQILHIFWFIMIMRMVVRAIILGKVEKDIRSASEDSADETNQANKSAASDRNGATKSS